MPHQKRNKSHRKPTKGHKPRTADGKSTVIQNIHINKVKNYQHNDGNMLNQKRYLQGGTDTSTDESSEPEQTATELRKTEVIPRHRMISFNQFWQKMRGFDSGIFILILADPPCHIKHLLLLTCPWDCVLDHDPERNRSNSTDLSDQILMIQDKERLVRWKCISDPDIDFFADITTWFQIGSPVNDDQPDTSSWFKAIQNDLSKVTDRLAGYTVSRNTEVSVMMMFPKDELLRQRC